MLPFFEFGVISKTFLWLENGLIRTDPLLVLRMKERAARYSSVESNNTVSVYAMGLINELSIVNQTHEEPDS